MINATQYEILKLCLQGFFFPGLKVISICTELKFFLKSADKKFFQAMWNFLSDKIELFRVTTWIIIFGCLDHLLLVFAEMLLNLEGNVVQNGHWKEAFEE